MGSLAAVFLAIFVLLNVMLYTMVIRRVTRLAGIADQVSLGNIDAGEFKTQQQGRDRRADRGDGPDEGEPRAGDEDARRLAMRDRWLNRRSARQVRDQERPRQGRDGVVYKGFDPHIERVVAIKTIRKDLVDPDLAQQFMARFKNEAQAAGRLHHPNIVGVYEYGEDDNVAFIAMEYVEGAGPARLPEPPARRFDVRAARRAHDAAPATRSNSRTTRGVVHRDIKPSNLHRDRHAARSRSPTSASRASTRSNLTTAGMVIGTPSYMSPEQCRGLDSRRALRPVQRAAWCSTSC